VGEQLLSDSSMRNHPLNPMTDSDLRRWLRRQTAHPVGLVAHATVSRGASAITRALAESANRGEHLTIVDAINEADLLAIGEACAGAPLLTGGSGIALGLARNFATAGRLKGEGARRGSHAGPAAILAGSCSAKTLEQIERHIAAHPGMAVSPDDVLAGRTTPAQAAAFAERHAGDSPIIYSSAAPDRVAASQAQFGVEAVAHAMEAFFADAARRVLAGGVSRLVVAGGETSGAVVSALGLASLEIGPEIDPGVPVLYADALAMALKSGNFGAPDFFEKALRVMEGRL